MWRSDADSHMTHSGWNLTMNVLPEPVPVRFPTTVPTGLQRARENSAKVVSTHRGSGSRCHRVQLGRNRSLWSWFASLPADPTGPVLSSANSNFHLGWPFHPSFLPGVFVVAKLWAVPEQLPLATAFSLIMFVKTVPHMLLLREGGLRQMRPAAVFCQVSVPRVVVGVLGGVSGLSSPPAL